MSEHYEQATAAPGEKRQGRDFGLRLGLVGKDGEITLDGVPLKRVRKVVITAEVGHVTQVELTMIAPVDASVDVVDVTSISDSHQIYERADA